MNKNLCRAYIELLQKAAEGAVVSPTIAKMYMGGITPELSRQALKNKEAAEQSAPAQENPAAEVKAKQNMLRLLLGLEQVPAAIKAEVDALQGAKKCEPGCKHDGSCPGCKR